MAHKHSFTYHAEIAAEFPAARAGVILAAGLQNGATPPDLEREYVAEQRAVRNRLEDISLSEVESLAAWRAAFRRFGVNPTKYRSAVEALLRRLTKRGDIPSINALVDLCNLVSIRYALPVAAFDVTRLAGQIEVHFASGREDFNPIGAPAGEQPEAGEVIFSDASGVVVARRWCWRQGMESAARPGTQRAIIVTEAQHAGGESAVQAALDDLERLVNSYIGGSLVRGIVAPHSLRFETLHPEI